MIRLGWRHWTLLGSCISTQCRELDMWNGTGQSQSSSAALNHISIDRDLLFNRFLLSFCCCHELFCQECKCYSFLSSTIARPWWANYLSVIKLVKPNKHPLSNLDMHMQARVSVQNAVNNCDETADSNCDFYDPILCLLSHRQKISLWLMHETSNELRLNYTEVIFVSTLGNWLGLYNIIIVICNVSPLLN